MSRPLPPHRFVTARYALAADRVAAAALPAYSSADGAHDDRTTNTGAVHGETAARVVDPDGAITDGIAFARPPGVTDALSRRRSSGKP